MTDGLESSAAWAALPKRARKVYAAITTEIAAQGGDSAVVTYETLQDEHHCSPPAPCLRLLRYLGLIEVGTGKSLAGVYRLGQGWRDLSESDVARLVQLAHEVRPRAEQQAHVGR